MSVHENDPVKIQSIDDAWAEYLAETKGLLPHKYARVEPYAWARLRAKLGQLKVARKLVA